MAFHFFLSSRVRPSEWLHSKGNISWQSNLIVSFPYRLEDFLQRVRFAFSFRFVTISWAGSSLITRSWRRATKPMTQLPITLSHISLRIHGARGRLCYDEHIPAPYTNLDPVRGTFPRWEHALTRIAWPRQHRPSPLPEVQECTGEYAVGWG